MNVNTGELLRIFAGEELPEGFTPIPPIPELEAQARALTAKTGRGRVDLTADSPLSRWAVQQNQRKKKVKAKRRARRKAVRKAKQRQRRRG